MEDRRNQQQNQQAQNDQRQPQQSQHNVSPLGDSQAARSSGQQGSDTGRARQQQQFDQTGGQQSGGSGSDRFADQIRERMEVVDDAGQHIGTVDHVDGDRIKLARSDSSDGQHHYVSLSQVSGIEGNRLRLRERGDNDFGQEAG